LFIYIRGRGGHGEHARTHTYAHQRRQGEDAEREGGATTRNEEEKEGRDENREERGDALWVPRQGAGDGVLFARHVV
jgi:hypothetical protein